MGVPSKRSRGDHVAGALSNECVGNVQWSSPDEDRSPAI